MNDDDVERLQTKIAFLEKANIDLSDVIYRQQEEIRALAARLDTFSARLESVQYAEREAERERSPDDERPPHY